MTWLGIDRDYDEYIHWCTVNRLILIIYLFMQISFIINILMLLNFFAFVKCKYISGK